MRPMDSLPGIHLGTSAFTAAGWECSFYPADPKPAEYLSYYAKDFETVEVDRKDSYFKSAEEAMKAWESSSH
jgi:uncharacterized protein YecE (DUF72 family)